MNVKITNWLCGETILEVETDSVKSALEAYVAAGRSLAFASGAILNGANLVGARLNDATLRTAADFIQGPVANGLATFAYRADDGSIRIMAGYHNFALAEARNYWSGKDNRQEALAVLDYFEAVARFRNW